MGKMTGAGESLASLSNSEAPEEEFESAPGSPEGEEHVATSSITGKPLTLEEAKAEAAAQKVALCDVLGMESSQSAHGTFGGHLGGRLGDNRFMAGRARNSRAKCNECRCRKNIVKGEPRIGKKPPSLWFDHALKTKWYHLDCIFKSFERVCYSTKTITATECIEEIDLVFTQEELEKVDGLVVEHNEKVEQRIKRIKERNEAFNKISQRKPINPSDVRKLLPNERVSTRSSERSRRQQKAAPPLPPPPPSVFATPPVAPPSPPAAAGAAPRRSIDHQYAAAAMLQLLSAPDDEDEEAVKEEEEEEESKKRPRDDSAAAGLLSLFKASEEDEVEPKRKKSCSSDEDPPTPTSVVETGGSTGGDSDEEEEEPVLLHPSSAEIRKVQQQVRRETLRDARTALLGILAPHRAMVEEPFQVILNELGLLQDYGPALFELGVQSIETLHLATEEDLRKAGLPPKARRDLRKRELLHLLETLRFDKLHVAQLLKRGVDSVAALASLGDDDFEAIGVPVTKRRSLLAATKRRANKQRSTAASWTF